MDASSSFSVGQGSLHFVRGRSFLWARGGLEAALPPCVRRKPLRTRVAHVRGVLLGGSRHRVLTGDDIACGVGSACMCRVFPCSHV